MTPGGERWPVIVAAVLTFGTGALDVLTLMHLGGVFASVMTGNLALMGLGVARTDGSALIHTAVAVLSYVIGVAVGSRITGVRQADHPAWPPRVTVALGVQFIVLCALAVGWVVTGANPAGGVQIALLAAAAGGMGMQSAAMRGLGAAVATTYLTGTLTSLIEGWMGAPKRRSDSAGVASLVAAVVGAACGGLLLLTAPVVTPMLTLVPLAAVLAVAVYRRRSAP
ncbi:MAG: YoaK family protein [Mycobacterium sp.]